MNGKPRMRVLLTRPRADAEATAEFLAAQHIEAVIVPLIEISDIAGAVPDLAGVQALLVTSANGARALARAATPRDIPVFAVGDASAEAALQAGFSDINSASGDVAALAALVQSRLKPTAGALFHAAGSAIAGDLAAELAEHDFTVHRSQLYRAQTVATLPEAAHRALKDGTVDAALFYSPRTAAHFVHLIVEAGLESQCRRLIAGCLSAAVAEALEGLVFAETRIPATPNQTALIAVLTGKN